MNGKKTCNTLKAIRQRIADENHIPFETGPCTFQGECRGTCPACEAEVRYLENELTARKRLGKSVVLAGIAACVMLAGTGCADTPDTPQPTATPTTQTTSPTEETVGEIVLDGDVPYVYEEELDPEEITDGLIPPDIAEIPKDITYLEEMGPL